MRIVLCPNGRHFFAVMLVGCAGSGSAAPPAPAAAQEPTTRELSRSNASDVSACTLNFNSIPAAVVVLDGRTLGTTPQLNVSAAPGLHKILFTDSSGERATSVTCRAGETKTVAVRVTPLAQ